MSGKLTDKQERFCQEYLIDLNATQAAKRSGYSEKTAQIIGFELYRLKAGGETFSTETAISSLKIEYLTILLLLRKI